nr:MAG TPA: hypothetical protein [Caudoviricetes sp.]
MCIKNWILFKYPIFFTLLDSTVKLKKSQHNIFYLNSYILHYHLIFLYFHYYW